MPIFYYDDIDLATNQLLDVALEIISDVDNEPAADNFAGRIAFDQATDTFSFYNGTAWVDLTGTGGVVSVDAQNGVKVDTTTVIPSNASVGLISLSTTMLSPSLLK